MALNPQTTIAALPVVDVDSHLTEPPDLWTSRLPQRWLDVAPHVVWDERTQEHRWQIGDVRLHSVGYLAMGGWREPYPYAPSSLDEADPASWNAAARVKWLDTNRLAAQVLYPNLWGFDSHAFLALGEDVALACLQAYNDFLTEWCSVAPERLIPIMNLPFWDLDAAVVELERCHDMGHRGVLLAAHYEKAGYPNVAEPPWEPVLAAAQERDLSINFHVGFSKLGPREIDARWTEQGRAVFAQLTPDQLQRYIVTNVRNSIPSFLSNAEAIADIITNGVCQRFPRLNFVSVESGFGYLPFLLQAMDWQWTNAGVTRVDPSFELLPSEYFRRQIYGTFWYEQPNLGELEALQDNVMFETDFPHPTSLTPGPFTSAMPPRQTIDEHLGAAPSDVAAKVLYDNAARLYHLPPRD